jgi:hypothetical protein
MRTVRGFTILLLLVVSSAVVQALGEGLYGQITDALKAFADPNTGLTSFPTLFVPLGGLSEGMGTAYSAVALDSGFIESNPAASSLLKESELALYHHAWISDSNLEGVVYTIRFNDLGIGFGGKFLYVPFPAYNEWGARGATDYVSESIGTVNVSYNLFSDYYFSAATAAAGVNFKVAYRNIPVVFALNQSALAVMADAGLQTSFNFMKFYSARAKNFSVGVVVKNLGVSTLADEALPHVATAGFAWSPLRPWIIAVDGNLPFSFAGEPPAPGAYLAIGTTVNITDFVSVQAGGLVSAYNPKISVGAALALGTLALTMNYNLDLSGSANPMDKFSVEARFVLGDSGRGDIAKKAEALYLQGIEEYAAGNYAGAIDLWQQVLAIDPKYTPAEHYLRVAQDSLALQQQASGTK